MYNKPTFQTAKHQKGEEVYQSDISVVIMKKSILKKALVVMMSVGMILSLAACGGEEKEPSNIIIKNAAVYTVDENNPEA